MSSLGIVERRNYVICTIGIKSTEHELFNRNTQYILPTLTPPFAEKTIIALDVFSVDIALLDRTYSCSFEPCLWYDPACLTKMSLFERSNFLLFSVMLQTS